MVKRGLGRGLSSLIPSLAADDIVMEAIQVSSVFANPNQPRQRFDSDAFLELVASIRKHGIVQPVVVRPKENKYELVAGERRWRAAKEAGLTVIPAMIKESDDSESLQLALTENIQREDLNAVEEARAYRRLVDEFSYTQAELAEIVGKNRATVANTIRLLQLSEVVQCSICEGQISSGHARALLALSEQEEQNKLAKRVISEGLSVRQTEELARLWQLSKDKAPRERKHLAPATKAIVRKLGKSLGAKVRTKIVGQKIKVEIEFENEEDIKRLEGLVAPEIGNAKPPPPLQ